MRAVGFKAIKPEPLRYVFKACRECSKLRLVFKGPATEARAVFRKATMNGEIVFFESQSYGWACRCAT